LDKISLKDFIFFEFKSVLKISILENKRIIREIIIIPKPHNNISEKIEISNPIEII